MHIIRETVEYFLDFLFPKTISLIEIEGMSNQMLLETLSPATDLKDENILAVWSYKDKTVKEIIWELKYKGNKKIALKLGSILVDVLKSEIADKALFESLWSNTPLLLPIPISNKRRRDRGWNQTEMLGEVMQNIDSDAFEYSKDILSKTKHSDSQARSHATKREREENLVNSIVVLNTERVRGRCVVVLDDVTTSGSTFGEARRALKKAGAKKILCLAVAH
ncbi:MAG: comF family protein [Parcubacteria bacterium C7867-005]|nr:MAG: comF family protein [Parcubacteria bacterium C7867-005]